jgi:hypothetical protein
MAVSKSDGSNGNKTANRKNCFDVNFKYDLSDNRCVVPRIMIRCPLFAPVEYRGANAKNRPVYNEPTLLGTWEYRLYQTAGEQLTQASEDVLIELIKMSLHLNLQPSERIILNFQADEMLKATGHKLGTKNRHLLAAELNRLKRASFRLEKDEWVWETGFIADVLVDNRRHNSKSAGSYRVEMNPNMTAVFGTGVSYLKLDIRKSLRSLNDRLAMWLYDFYESHEKPFVIKEERLKQMTGRTLLLDSSGKQLKPEQQNSKWLADLNASLSNLENATGWKCGLEDGKVTVVRAAAPKKAEPQSAQDKSKENDGDYDDI